MAINVRLSGAQTGHRSESDVRFNYNNLLQLVAASNSTTASNAQFYSSDGGGTWSQSNLPTVSGDARQGDPAVDWTSDGTAWALAVGIGMTGAVIRCFKSTAPNHQTWTFDSTLSGTQTNVDKPNLWIDHSPTSPYKDNMYALWWNNGPTYVARRAGPSGTWQAPLQVSGSETSGGSDGGDIKTNTYGDVFAFWPSEGNQKLFVSKSPAGGAQGGGAQFGPPVQIATTYGSFLVPVPAQAIRAAGSFTGVLLYISGGAYRTATKDMVYAVWMDLAGGAGCNAPGNAPGSNTASTCRTRIYFSRSGDGGAHWDTPVKINDQPSLNDQFFPRLAVDETSGDLMVIYYDTVSDPGRTKTDVWMQASTDDGASWSSAVKITTAQTDETSAGSDGSQYGDYIGLTGYAGQYFGCWTDRRSGGVEEIWGAQIPLVQRALTFQLHRDHYGQDQIDAARTQPSGPVITTAFAVAVDGFTARELGITGPGSYTVGPKVTLSPSSGLVNDIAPTSLQSTDPTFALDVLQRFWFNYDLDFGADDSAFTSFPGLTETVTLTANFQSLSAQSQITLMKQPNPYILQGASTWWLSSDIRLIQVASGERAFNVLMQADPYAFLSELIDALEKGQGEAGGQSFDDKGDEASETITAAALKDVGGQLKEVYNFAIARVHYQAASQPANNVRLFFRLFAANSTTTDFHVDSTYSRDPAAYPVAPTNFGQHTIPTPGVINGQYVSLPCFGSARQNPTQTGAANSLPQLQQDPLNNRNLPATGGPVKDFYYGCFLDINQTAPVLPQAPPLGNANGPWPPGTGVSLERLGQAFIRGAHQCLVAELAFDPVPIGAGTQPFNSDKLAQRNIAWSPVANPGLHVSRQALETFEVRPTTTLAPGETPDEIMIDWTDVPAGQKSEIYLPAVRADEVLATASRLYGQHRLSRVDANTIGCLTGGISFIPLPAGTGNGADFAGLMSVALPSGIKKGQVYTVIVRQLTNESALPPPPPPAITVPMGQPEPIRWRKVRGAFQINIPVSTAELLLEREEVLLSIFRWIAEAIPVSDRWYPVFQRYLRMIAIRVSEMGGDPSQIIPSPNGYDGIPHRRRHHKPECEEGAEEHLEFTGKVQALVYDHFGDFDGFILESHCGGEHRFYSREADIEALAREAWAARIVTSVLVEKHHRYPLCLILRRSSTAPRHFNGT